LDLAQKKNRKKSLNVMHPITSLLKIKSGTIRLGQSGDKMKLKTVIEAIKTGLRYLKSKIWKFRG
jgi:hypothetical protein